MSFSSFKEYKPYTPHAVESALNCYYTALAIAQVPTRGDFSGNGGSGIDPDELICIKCDIDRALAILPWQTKELVWDFCCVFEGKALDWDGASVSDAAEVGRKWGMSADEVLAQVRGALRRMSRFLEPNGYPPTNG